MKPSSSTNTFLPPVRPKPGKWLFWAGFGFFYFALYVAMAEKMPHGLFIFFAVELPMTGFILALMRRTRRFGLGMLLAALIFVATALATCGALFEKL